MSAFGGKADINQCVAKSPLIAISGHFNEHMKPLINRGGGDKQLFPAPTSHVLCGTA